MSVVFPEPILPDSYTVPLPLTKVVYENDDLVRFKLRRLQLKLPWQEYIRVVAVRVLPTNP